MQHIGKILLLGGIILIVVCAGVWGLGRLGFRGLPGDIRYESPNVKFYFPKVTCLVLSVLLTALFWLWRWLGRG